MFTRKNNFLKTPLFVSIKRFKKSVSGSNELPTYVYANEDPSKRNTSKSLFTWGFSSTGALCNEKLVVLEKKKNQNICKPTLVRYFNRMKIQDAACGYGFTVIAATATNTEHRLFGSGLNTDSQIGYHLDQKKHEPLNRLARPAPIHLPFKNPHEKVIKVACGRAHTFVLTSEKQLLSFGNNSFGQCGRTIVENEQYFASMTVNQIDEIDEKIKDIVCGQDHTLILTESGKLYACGWGADGQTGLGHYKNQDKFTLVQGDIKGEHIVKVSSSADAVLALNDKGEVFGWGNSEYAQFNLITKEKQLNVPRRLKFKNVDKKLTDVACGGTMCAILDDSGNVYVWGFGILGQGPQVEHLEQPSKLAPQLLGCTDVNPKCKVVSIQAGLSHFAALTNDHDLYMWGRNRQACLGLLHRDNQYFPLKVPIAGRVKKVCLGVDHTAAICEHLL